MCEKGRVKWFLTRLLCLHKQVWMKLFDGRSGLENAKHFQGSVRIRMPIIYDARGGDTF